jgi:hypothetical protein
MKEWQEGGLKDTNTEIKKIRKNGENVSKIQNEIKRKTERI